MTASSSADPLWIEESMLIDGQLVSADRSFDNVNPATEQVIGVCTDGDASHMDRAIGAARRAFDETSWRDDVDLRVRCIRQLHDAFEKHAEDFGRTIVAEIGTPMALLNMAQWDTPVGGMPWLADLLERYEWREELGEREMFGSNSRRYTVREPVGVVGAITPWNYPVQINVAKSLPALAAGNTVVLKPAPDSPWAATLMGKLIADETDIPDGVFNVVTSSDHSVGEQLSTDPRVDMVTFTGSTATGRRVMAAASATVKKVFLELGGKSAHLILDDAKVPEVAALGAYPVVVHAGQGCAITSRMLVPRARFDEAVASVKATLETIPYGDPTDPGNLMGPLISERQRERVLAYIAKAVDEGATVVTGGGRPAHLPTGWFVEPTLLVDVGENDTVAQEEIFGPVLVMHAHDGDDDAVRIANNSIYGLSGAVSSGSQERAEAVARRLRTGTVGINGGIWYGPDVPFGGYRQSGVGRESGVEGFEEYLETKSIAVPA